MAKKQPAAKRTFDDLLKRHKPGPRELAVKLRGLVLKALTGAEENIYGGAKVGLALYSRRGTVLCGIQPSGDACLFYVHHIDKLDHERLKFEGKGKHAKQIRFLSVDDVRDKDVIWLLREIENAAKS